MRTDGDGERTVLVTESHRPPGAAYLIARFERLTEGEYLVAVEPFRDRA